MSDNDTDEPRGFRIWWDAQPVPDGMNQLRAIFAVCWRDGYDEGVQAERGV